MKYDVGHFSVKAWKYILQYFVIMSLVNAYILYCKTFTRKRKADIPIYMGSVLAADETNCENVHMGLKKGKRLKCHCIQQKR